MFSPVIREKAAEMAVAIMAQQMSTYSAEQDEKRFLSLANKIAEWLSGTATEKRTIVDSLEVKLSLDATGFKDQLEKVKEQVDKLYGHHPV